MSIAIRKSARKNGNAPSLLGRECTDGSIRRQLTVSGVKTERRGKGGFQGYDLNANVNGPFTRIPCNNVHGWQKSILAMSVPHSQTKTRNIRRE